MKAVAIEAGDTLKAHPAGVARYAIELAAALRAVQDDEFDVRLWYPTRRLLRAHLRARSLPGAWYGRVPPRTMPALFHATACRFPRWQSAVEIATAHDFYALRDEVSPDAAQLEQHMAYVRRSQWVICVSETTREHLHRLIDYPRERTVAIPLAVNHRFRPQAAESILALRKRRRLPAEFLLFVGKARPNKNLHGLIRAYAGSGLEMPLLIAGRQPSRLHQALQEEIRRSGCQGRVSFIGFVSDAELPVLMAAARAFCFPSTFEGFGLPVLEALACGTPVLTSQGTATEEAAAGHAVLVDPHSLESMVDGLQSVVELDPLACRAGSEYARSFTWQRVAEHTLAVYRRALQPS